MEKILNKRFLGSMFFNIAETALIFLIGKALILPNKFIIIIMLIFMISRFIIRKFFSSKALHFKTWYRCLVWSLLILLSLFILLKVDLVISILFTIFSAFIMTEKSNIYDMYLWKPANESKFRDIDEYIKFNNLNNNLLDFEDNLKRRDNKLFLIYKYRFLENRTFSEISELLDISTRQVSDDLDKIALSIRIYCRI